MLGARHQLGADDLIEGWDTADLCLFKTALFKALLCRDRTDAILSSSMDVPSATCPMTGFSSTSSTSSAGVPIAIDVAPVPSSHGFATSFIFRARTVARPETR
jgi:hypothetical protein